MREKKTQLKAYKFLRPLRVEKRLSGILMVQDKHAETIFRHTTDVSWQSEREKQVKENENDARIERFCRTEKI